MKRFLIFLLLWAIFPPFALFALWHWRRSNKRMRALVGPLERQAQRSRRYRKSNLPPSITDSAFANLAADFVSVDTPPDRCIHGS